MAPSAPTPGVAITLIVIYIIPTLVVVVPKTVIVVTSVETVVAVAATP